jgi:hypothetical protein
MGKNLADRPLRVIRDAPAGRTLLKTRGLSVRFPHRDITVMQATCVVYVTFRQTLRFGKLRPLGNLEKVPEAPERDRTKVMSELAVPDRGAEPLGFGNR